MAGLKDSVAVTALRIAGHVACERLRPVLASSAADVPSSVDALTPAWWTAVMCAGHPRAEVLAFDALGSSSGTHQRHRFVLTYNDAGQAARLPYSVFTKTGSSGNRVGAFWRFYSRGSMQVSTLSRRYSSSRRP